VAKEVRYKKTEESGPKMKGMISEVKHREKKDEAALGKNDALKSVPARAR